MITEKRYLNVTEIGEYLGLSKWGIYDLVAQRKIPFIKISHRVLRFDKLSIDKWMEKRAVKTLQEIS